MRSQEKYIQCGMTPIQASVRSRRVVASTTSAVRGDTYISRAGVVVHDELLQAAAARQRSVHWSGVVSCPASRIRLSGTPRKRLAMARACATATGASVSPVSAKTVTGVRPPNR